MSADPLSLYRNARRYDRLAEALFAGGEDLAFYRRLAARYPGPVLELACGSGRLTIPLALEGTEITGIDRSPEMLAVAREKAGRQPCAARWVEADIRRFDLNQRFAFVFISTNSLLHLHQREDLEACFAHVRAHLQPEGRFVVDVFNPALSILTRDPDTSYPVVEYDDPELGGRVVMTQTSRYDAATQVNHVEWRFTTDPYPEEVVCLAVRILYPQELDALLTYNGFAIEKKYGTYDEAPFESGSPKQIVVCRVSA